MKRKPAQRSSVSLAVCILLSQTPLFGQTSPAVETIEATTNDGRSVPLLVAGSESATGAVLIVHDWFGVSDMVVEGVERLAGLGYRVAAVDLYHGRSATDHPGATELMGGLNPEQVEEDLGAAVAYLIEDRRTLAVLGFSMGGAPALRAALMSGERLRAVAAVYGGGLENVAGVQDLISSIPVLIVTGSDDAWPMASLRELWPLTDASATFPETLILRGARHGFAQPLYAGGDNYDEAATRRMWGAVEGLLADRMTAPGLSEDR